MKLIKPVFVKTLFANELLMLQMLYYYGSLQKRKINRFFNTLKFPCHFRKKKHALPLTSNVYKLQSSDDILKLNSNIGM